MCVSEAEVNAMIQRVSRLSQGDRNCTLPGIVIRGRVLLEDEHPCIQAFVYGRSDLPERRTLPYGRWKGAA